MDNSTLIGLDEAGRGPVIGPIVMAAVEIRKEDEKLLKKWGVRDSKQLTAWERESLAKKIMKVAVGVETVVIYAADLDKMRQRRSLNRIELDAFIELVNRLEGVNVFLDLPERNGRFSFLLRHGANRPINLTAEHKADENHLVVGAASIIAKVERDRRMRELEKQVGLEIGSGYPNDPHTINFLRKWLEEHDELPEFVRKSWMTARRLAGEKEQRGLADFGLKKG